MLINAFRGAGVRDLPAPGGGYYGMGELSPFFLSPPGLLLSAGAGSCSAFLLCQQGFLAVRSQHVLREFAFLQREAGDCRDQVYRSAAGADLDRVQTG